MNNKLTLPPGVDNLSLPQKIVAIGFIGIAAYFILPFLITVMVNLYIAVALAIPICYIALNPHLIWGVAKTLSQLTTNWIIGLSPLSAMDRYYEWVLSKLQVIRNAKNDVIASEMGISKQINDKEKSYKELMNKASIAEDQGNSIQADTYSSQAMSDKQFLEDLIPIRDDMKIKITYLQELDDVFQSNAEKLNHSINNTKMKYTTLKKIKKGMQSADDIIGGANEATRIYNVALSQTNDQINKMTASIQQYENNIKPMLADAKFSRELQQGEARRLLNEFRTGQLSK